MPRSKARRDEGNLSGLSKHQVQEAICEIKNDLQQLGSIQDRIVTRLAALEKHYSDMEGESSFGEGIKNVICTYLDYIPGVGSLYQASNTFIHSLQHDGDSTVGSTGLSVIEGAVKDILHFSNILEEGVVITVHSVFENTSQNAFGHLLDSLSRNISNKEKIESVVRQNHRQVDLSKKGFLLVHHQEENDPFHIKFVENRVKIAKFALTKGAVYLGLISYDNYVRNSLITVIVPNGLKEGAPIKISWKFDRAADGSRDGIVKAVGTLGKCTIISSNAEETIFKIEALRNQCYYWFTGKVHIREIELLENEPEEYQLLRSCMELEMFSGDPNLPLGNISELEFMLKAKK